MWASTSARRQETRRGAGSRGVVMMASGDGERCCAAKGFEWQFGESRWVVGVTRWLALDG